MKFFFIISSIFLVTITFAQPSTSNLFLFDLVQLNDSTWDVHSPKFLSKFNERGYNNQPYFLNNTQVLFTSQTPPSNNTDIRLIDLKNRTIKNLTDTQLAEYSPTPMPGSKSYSVVRVEADGLQTLWKYELNPNGTHQNLFPSFKENIGYHNWINDTLVALFVLGDSPTLRIGNIKTKIVANYASDIGRCLRTSSDDKLLYIHKYSDQFWYLKKFDPFSKRIEILTEVTPGHEDFELYGKNKIIMGQDAVLLIYDMDLGQWFPAGDLSAYGIKNITRLSFSNGKIILTETE